MVYHQIVEKEDGITITLSGTLSIQYAAEIYHIFLEVLGKYNLISVEHKDIEEADISYYQLIYAMNNTAMVTGKKIEFNYSGEPKINNMIERLGFQPPIAGSLFNIQQAGN